jgi:hypothetical protein
MVLVVGAAIGLALGVVVSIATDIPLAPEVGLLIGLFVAWLLRRKRSWLPPHRAGP